MTAPIDRIVPFNVEAEEAVLGSLLLDSQAIIHIASFLRPDDFYREKNRWVYESALALYERGQAIDFLTVRNELERNGRLEEAGGASFLTSLINAVPTSIHIEHYARIVERASIRRRLISAASDIAMLAYAEDEEIEVTLDKVESRVFEATQRASLEAGFQPMSVYVQEMMEYMVNPPDGAGILTGLADLDQSLGGLMRGDVTLVIGRPGLGKTSWMDTVSYNAAHGGLPVAFYSLEMKGMRLARRHTRMLTGIPGHRLRIHWDDLREDERQAIDTANQMINRLPLTVNEKRGMTIEEIRRTAREEHHRRPFALLMIDYLQLVLAEKKTANRNNELEYIMNTLRELAGALDVHILAASQLSRDVEKRGKTERRPALGDIRDSGTLEQGADNVIGLYRDDYYDEPLERRPVMPAENIILKQREGEMNVTIPVGWWGRRSMFVDAAAIDRLNAQESRRG